MRILVVSSQPAPGTQGDWERLCADTVTALSRHHEVQVLRELPWLASRRADRIRAPRAAIAGARASRGAIRQFRPDLILVWDFTRIPHSALWAAHRSAIPLALYVGAPVLPGLYRDDLFARHLTRRGGGGQGLWAALMRLVNLSPELRIRPQAPMSASLAWASEALRRESPPPEFVRVGLDCVIFPATARDTEFAAIRRSPAPRQPLVACLTPVPPLESAELGVRAFARLVSQLGIDARLEVIGVGGPSHLARLEQLAAQAGVAERVALRGRLASEEMIDLFERASVALVPGLGAEPLALAGLEAAFARLPVVAADGGALPEALRPDSEALYFPAEDWAACAGALVETLHDSVATAKRVSRARARARELSFDRYITQLGEFLQAAASGRRG